MDMLFIIGVVVAVILAIFALGFILIYNGLIQLKNRVENAFAQIDVQLKKRYDLVPNLVETVKGYAKHEKEVFLKVTEARTAVMKAGKNTEQRVGAENMLTGALKSLFAVSENYPQLRAAENFKMLQEELSGIENKIAYARQFYNDSAMQFNTTIHQFPSNIVAGMLSYKNRDYLEFEEEAKKNVKVSF